MLNVLITWKLKTLPTELIFILPVSKNISRHHCIISYTFCLFVGFFRSLFTVRVCVLCLCWCNSSSSISHHPLSLCWSWNSSCSCFLCCVSCSSISLLPCCHPASTPLMITHGLHTHLLNTPSTLTAYTLILHISSSRALKVLNNLISSPQKVICEDQKPSSPICSFALLMTPM